MSLAFENRGDYVDEQPILFQQGLFEESSTKKAPLGAIRRLNDGREFIYCQNGNAALAVGKLLQSEACDVANTANLAITANEVVSNKSIDFTLGDSSLANTANGYEDGFAYINTGAGAGYGYKIKSHAAIAANANGTIYLYDKIRANIASANSKLSLMPHPCKRVIVTPGTITGSLIGVPTFAITANYYFWAQKKGPAVVLFAGTLVNGDCCIAAANGAVGPSANGSETEFQVGMVLANNANAHYGLVDLDL